MRPSTFLIPFLTLLQHTLSQSTIDSSEYTDSSLSITGDEDSVLCETASTPANTNAAFGPPNVFLNASVNVGEIFILVAKLSVKINLDAQVPNLLQFNTGVDLSIGRVSLLIQNVSAKVRLQACLENLVTIIKATLSSIDLHPVLATLRNAVGHLIGAIGDGLSGTGTSSNSPSSKPMGLASTSTDLSARSLGVGLQNLEFSQNMIRPRPRKGHPSTNHVRLASQQTQEQCLDRETRHQAVDTTRLSIYKLISVEETAVYLRLDLYS
jgi:hypothetical protein